MCLLKGKFLEGNHKSVADIGEFGLIDRIQKILPEAKHEDVLIGIGDDTAVIKIDAHRAWLVTCDIQVEDQHFRLQHISPYQLGRRAMAVNLSDIAAMGGKPTFALVSLGFPKSLPLSDFENLFKGMGDQLAEFSAIIIGGNLSNTESKMIIDITLLGEVSPKQFLTRSGAKAGDRIFVTGNLGASGAGFYLLEKYGKNYPTEFDELVQSHRQPIPRIQIGQRIAQSSWGTAMIDLSDGLASDLNHICKMSSVGAEIYQYQIPLPDNIFKASALTNHLPLQLALHSGEDYELLFAARPEIPNSLLNSIIKDTGVPITEIGRILPADCGYYIIDRQSEKSPIQPKGWDHFSQ